MGVEPKRDECRHGAVALSSMTRIALCAGLLCASSYFVIPLPFTPIVLSLHTVMVNIIGLVLKPRHGVYTVLIYLFMGIVGLPVFSGGTAGVGKLFGPSGGFYFGFLFAVLAIALLRGKKNSFVRYAVVSVIVGMPIQHLFAVFFMCIHNGFNVGAAVLTVSLPFIPGDVIKCLIASGIGVELNKVIRDK